MKGMCCIKVGMLSEVKWMYSTGNINSQLAVIAYMTTCAVQCIVTNLVICAQISELL